MQRAERAIAEQLLQPRGLEYTVRASERQRLTGNATHYLANHVFSAVKGRRRLPPWALPRR